MSKFIDPVSGEGFGWYQSTPLVPIDRSLLSRSQRHAIERQEALYRTASGLLRFAVGIEPGQIADFAHPKAQFIDVRGGEHEVNEKFVYDHVLSTSHTGWDLWGGRTEFLDKTAITTRILLETAPKHDGAPRKIIWSVIWQWSDRKWQVIHSHTSYRNLGEFPRKHTSIDW